MLTEDCPKPTRSEQTRQKLILAALEVIGAHGYELATTRMLTAHAGVNLAAIPYHFESKEELYRAAAEFLAERMKADQAEPLQRLRLSSEAAPDAQILIDALVEFMLALARNTLVGVVPPSWVQFFLRSQADPADATGQIFRQALQPSRAEVRAVVARISAGQPDSLPVRALAFSLFHQAFYFRLAEPVLLQHLARTSLTAEVQEQLLQTLTQGLRAQLQAAARR